MIQKKDLSVADVSGIFTKNDERPAAGWWSQIMSEIGDLSEWGRKYQKIWSDKHERLMNGEMVEAWML
jgi:hypothetical protein